MAVRNTLSPQTRNNGLIDALLFGSAGTTWLLTRSNWDLLHTWAGVVLILAAVIHLAIHWKWVTKVTSKLTAGFRRPEQISPLAGRTP